MVGSIKTLEEQSKCDQTFKPSYPAVRMQQDQPNVFAAPGHGSKVTCKLHMRLELESKILGGPSEFNTSMILHYLAQRARERERERERDTERAREPERERERERERAK